MSDSGSCSTLGLDSSWYGMETHGTTMPVTEASLNANWVTFFNENLFRFKLSQVKIVLSTEVFGQKLVKQTRNHSLLQYIPNTVKHTQLIAVYCVNVPTS